MDAFQPTLTLTALFVVLTLAVVVRAISLIRRVAPFDRKDRWTAMAAGVAVGWMAIHAGIATSGVLTLFESPPLTPFYLATALILGVAFAFSPLGTRLSQLPLIAIVGLNSFRLPLEVILHELYKHGDLPVQMTWSGLNFDVLTGISALVLVMLRRDLPKSVFWAWNLMGIGLLVTVVSIALLSSPLPFRTFFNEPAVLLVFDTPFNWVPSVHVWTAWVSHLIIFRALTRRSAHAGS